MKIKLPLTLLYNLTEDKEHTFIGREKDTSIKLKQSQSVPLNMSVKSIEIRNYPIKLGQFLKLSDIVQDGLEAKFIILEGMVRVNGEVELRRGRQLHRDDVITFEGHDYRCG